jgi:hypothetical protein
VKTCRPGAKNKNNICLIKSKKKFMQNRNRHLRTMAISVFILVISIFNFEKLAGSECIRTIHIVTLLVCGMAIGLFISSLFAMLRSK